MFFSFLDLSLLELGVRGGLHPVVSHKSVFGNQEIRQLELWNLAQWEISSVVPGKVLWRKCIGGLGAKINQQINQHLCEITRGPPPLDKTLQHCLILQFRVLYSWVVCFTVAQASWPPRVLASVCHQFPPLLLDFTLVCITGQTFNCILLNCLACTLSYCTVLSLYLDERRGVQGNTSMRLIEGVPEGAAQGNFRDRMLVFSCAPRLQSRYRHYPKATVPVLTSVKEEKRF